MSALAHSSCTGKPISNPECAVIFGFIAVTRGAPGGAPVLVRPDKLFFRWKIRGSALRRAHSI